MEAKIQKILFFKNKYKKVVYEKIFPPLYYPWTSALQQAIDYQRYIEYYF